MPLKDLTFSNDHARYLNNQKSTKIIIITAFTLAATLGAIGLMGSLFYSNICHYELDVKPRYWRYIGDQHYEQSQPLAICTNENVQFIDSVLPRIKKTP